MHRARPSAVSAAGARVPAAARRAELVVGARGSVGARSSVGSQAERPAHDRAPRRARPAACLGSAAHEGRQLARVSRVARVAVVVEEQRVVPVECPSVLLGGRLELVVDPVVAVLGLVRRRSVVDGDWGAARDAAYATWERAMDVGKNAGILTV